MNRETEFPSLGQWLRTTCRELYEKQGIQPPEFWGNGANGPADVAERLAPGARVVWSSGNKTGKTHEMSYGPFWWLSEWAKRGQKAYWLTLGQTEGVHLDTLWTEIARRYYELGGERIWGVLMRSGRLRVKANYLEALSVSSDRPQGAVSYSSPHTAVHIDEGGGVALYKVGVITEIERVMPQLVIITGNPESSVDEFGQRISDPKWQAVTTSGYDCDKWQAEHHRIPGLVTSEFSG